MLRLLQLSFFALPAAVYLGCGRDIADRHDASSQEVRGEPDAKMDECFHVVIIGDASRTTLLRTMGQDLGGTVPGNSDSQSERLDLTKDGRRFHVETCARDAIEPIASLLSKADSILLAVDATVGPLPVHREHILLARQMHAPTVAIAFTRSKLIDDAHLLELEELEMRELLNHYGLPGDTAACVFDHPDARATRNWKTYKGSAAIFDCMAMVTQRQPVEAPEVTANHVLAKGYALVPQESFVSSTAAGLRSGSARIILGGTSIDAKILAEPTISPGQHGELELHLDKPMLLRKGQRFVVLNEGHISGAALIKEIAQRSP